jgi:threonine dehydratase
VFLKLETLQPTFSYKIRGAFNTVLALVEDGGEVRPLVTASAGNHGRALAYAARAAGLRLTVYAPATAPRAKLDAIREAGAELKTCGDYDEAEVRAKEHGAEGAALFVSAYSHPGVVAGAGTIGLEILEDLPDVEAIVVPVGGGGLISGVAIAARGISDAVSILGVEVEASQAFTKSLAAGHIVPIVVAPTLADGLAGNLDPDAITFDIVRRLVLGIVLVDERGLQDAVAGIAREERLIAEAAGAAAAAGVLSGRIELDGRITAVILSGGNIDVEQLKALI